MVGTQRPESACPICDGDGMDARFGRIRVWEDDLWRLSLSGRGYVRGFGYLEPKRHVPHITDLDGAEAATFGPVLARVTTALKEAAGADLVYVYVFGGGIPHLHVHLGPHRDGDALASSIIRGNVDEQRDPSGATRLVSRDFPELDADELRRTAERARALLDDEAPG
jgi:diadenosine tetraphosphate (Ap4A) HIT family hydrolase